MEQMIYERPREKLRNQGASALLLVELLQLVLGSGGLRVSGAQLASAVEQHIQSNDISYESIIAIPGMGDAKTCQVLAVLELARRLAL